jgi:hypothetical protein
MSDSGNARFIDGEIAEIPPSTKVVYQKESAARQVLFHPSDLLVGQRHVANLTQIGERILEQIGISEAEEVLNHVYVDRELGQLRENLRKVLPRLGIVVRPRYTVIAQVLARVDLAVHYAHKRKLVGYILALAETRIIVIERPVIRRS